jgi:hypothetical protein
MVNGYSADGSELLAGNGLLAGCCGCSDDVKLDLHFVGDGADIGPDAVTNTEIEALEDESAGEDSIDHPPPGS